MRYEDWDVLLFPSDIRDDERPPIPVREFKTQCHVIPDTEVTLAHGTLDLPILTCCVPGLRAGIPFNISIHSWGKPSYSQFTRNCATANDRVKFQARLFIDGRLTSSISFGRRGPWPLVMTETNCIDSSATNELEFPAFRPDLLQHNSWAPDEDLGRIKVILSEGFASSESRPFIRVKNILAFSFQHAPMDVLESNGIAWPNPLMWRQATLEYAPPRPPIIESHAHSPRGVDCYSRKLVISSMPGARGLPVSPSPELISRRQFGSYRAHDPSSSRSTETERDNSPYKRAIRQSYSDVSMPDYGTSNLMEHMTLSTPGPLEDNDGWRSHVATSGHADTACVRCPEKAAAAMTANGKAPATSPFGPISGNNALKISTSPFGKAMPLKRFQGSKGTENDSPDNSQSSGSDSGSKVKNDTDDDSTPTGEGLSFGCQESTNPFAAAREERIL